MALKQFLPTDGSLRVELFSSTKVLMDHVKSLQNLIGVTFVVERRG